MKDEYIIEDLQSNHSKDLIRMLFPHLQDKSDESLFTGIMAST
jgi:hypothetical protein